MPAPKGHAPYPGCETGGAPRIYDEKFCDSLADEFEKWLFDNPESIWFYEFFDEKKRMHRQTLARCVERSEKLSELMDRAHKVQEGRIFRMGMMKVTDPGMSKFGLACIYKWEPPTKNEQNNANEDPSKTLISKMSNKSAGLLDE